MAGNQVSLSRFLVTRHEQDQQPTSRRSASTHKVPTNKKELQQAMQPSQPFKNETTRFEYATKKEYREHSPQEYEKDPRIYPQSIDQRDLFDDNNTLDSADLDSTITGGAPPYDNHQDRASFPDEEHYSSGAEDGSEDDNVNGIRDEEEHIEQQHYRGISADPSHSIQQQAMRKQSPMIPTPADDFTHVKPGHGSRFQAPHDLVNRPMHILSGDHEIGSKKRSHAEHYHHEEFEEQGLPKPRGDSGRRQQDQRSSPNGQQRNAGPRRQSFEESGSEAIIGAPKGPVEDYTDEQLKSMSFSDLQNEAFEYDPRAEAIAKAQTLGEPEQLSGNSKSHTKAQSLEDRWNKCMEGKAGEQESYYSKLSLSEWEETGDLFIGRFGDLMNKLRTARTQRRAIVAAGEREIEQREGLIKGKSANYDDDLKGMRRDGESVLRGKLISPSTSRQSTRKA